MGNSIRLSELISDLNIEKELEMWTYNVIYLFCQWLIRAHFTCAISSCLLLELFIELMTRSKYLGEKVNEKKREFVKEVDSERELEKEKRFSVVLGNKDIDWRSKRGREKRGSVQGELENEKGGKREIKRRCESV